MNAADPDSAIRLAAFRWLAEATTVHGDVLPRTLLEAGFDFDGRRIALIGPQGLWKPKLMDLSRPTTALRARGLSAHELRHAWATRAARNGTPAPPAELARSAAAGGRVGVAQAQLS